MRYTEQFKKGMARAIVAKGMDYKELSEKVGIHADTLRRWTKQYRDEVAEDQSKRKNYSDDYKKSVVKEMLLEGVTYKEMARRTGVSAPTLFYWDDRYRYEVMDDLTKESRRKKKQRYIKEMRWHRYGSSAGRYE